MMRSRLTTLILVIVSITSVALPDAALAASLLSNTATVNAKPVRGTHRAPSARVDVPLAPRCEGGGDQRTRVPATAGAVAATDAACPHAGPRTDPAGVDVPDAAPGASGPALSN